MSESQKWAIPKKGSIVRFPNNMVILPEQGAWVDWVGVNGKYWRKKEIQKDIIIYDIQPPPVVTEEIVSIVKIKNK